MAMAWKRTLASFCVGIGMVLGMGAAAAADSHEPVGTEAQGAVEIEEADAMAAAVETEVAELEAGAESAVEQAEESMDTVTEVAEESMDAVTELAEESMDTVAEVAEESMPVAAEESSPALGALGYDQQGRPGRIHVVVSGDTLWDISNAYLGTPWVWPSIWNDNGQVENPHLIVPGDRIWITPNEMRRISAEEAEALLAGSPAAPVEDFEPMPAAPDPMPAPPSLAAAEARRVRVPGRESTGMITPEVLKSAASVVDKDTPRLLMSQEDEAYIGLGEGEVSAGDEFTVFRTREAVEDPDTGELLGYHVEVLGWVRVEEAFPESSRVSIRMSTSAIEIGDRVMPREPLPPEVAVGASPAGVEGKISFFPQKRVLMGFGDFVYLNRGTLDGLEVGSPLEVYRPGAPAREVARDEYVDVPDRVIASMLVVRATDESAVAVVTTSKSELELGDRFRGAGSTE